MSSPFPSKPPAPEIASSVLIPLALTALALFMALFSKGFLEPDEISHFLFARAALHDWRQLTNVWARLGPTALYALAAPLGPIGPRLLAVGITALTAHAAARLLRRYLPENTSPFLRRHATAFAWLLLFAQPAFFLNSFAIMTEMPLALAWTAATLALLNRRTRLAGLLLGVGGLIRPEAWLALAAWPVVLFFFSPSPVRRLADWILPILLSLAPPLLWLILWMIAWHSPHRLFGTFPWPAASPYGRNGLLFLRSAVVALALWMWPLVILGACSLRKTNAQAHTPRMNADVTLSPILLLPVAGFFLFHALAGTLGLFGSMALPRYFVVVAPQLAILAFLGLVRLEPRFPKTLRTTTIALALLLIAALGATGYIPIAPSVEQQRLEIAAEALRARHGDPGTFIVNHPYLLLTLGLDPESPAHKAAFDRDQIAKAPSGTFLIADTTTWYYENRPAPEQLRQWGYVEDPAVAAEIDAVTDVFEPLTFKSPAAAGARVRLWIKQ